MLWRSKIWRLSLFHYPHPPEFQQTPSSDPNGNGLGHQMKSYMNCILSKFAIMVLMPKSCGEKRCVTTLKTAAQIKKSVRTLACNFCKKRYLLPLLLKSPVTPILSLNRPLARLAYKLQPVPGSQIVQWERIKTSKTKVRRAQPGKGDVGGGALSLPSPRAFFAFLITERLSTTISEPGTG